MKFAKGVSDQSLYRIPADSKKFPSYKDTLKSRDTCPANCVSRDTCPANCVSRDTCTANCVSRDACQANCVVHGADGADDRRGRRSAWSAVSHCHGL